MKSLNFLILVFLFSFFLNGQQAINNDIPKTVTEEFEKRYPGAKDVVWSTENNRFVARFSFNQKPVTAFYGKNMRWENSEMTVTKDDIPRIMLRKLQEDFVNFEINKITYHEKLAEQNIYIVDAKENNISRTIHFLNEGVFLKLIDEKGKVIKEDYSAKTGFQPIPAKDLPTSISRFLSVTYPNFKVDDAFNINNNEFNNAYLVQISNVANKNEIIKIYLSNDGTVLSTIDPALEQILPKPTVVEEQDRRKRRRDEIVGIPANMVPKSVIDAFNKRIRRHEELSWDTLRGMFIATYIDPAREQKNHSEFTPRGVWTRTMTEIDPKTMHQLVQRHLTLNYPTLKVHYVSSTITADKQRYILVKIYDPNWINDPMVYHELYFSNTGRFEKEIYANYKHPNDMNIGVRDAASSDKFLSKVDGKDTEVVVEFKKISTKEMPSSALKHARREFPEHRIQDTFILKDEETDEIIYWIILRKEGVRARIKAIYDFKGQFIETQEYNR